MRTRGFLAALAEWLERVDQGADPIEALHGHLCGPRCWHWSAMSPEKQAALMRAPWNAKSEETK